MFRFLALTAPILDQYPLNEGKNALFINKWKRYIYLGKILFGVETIEAKSRQELSSRIYRENIQ